MKETNQNGRESNHLGRKVSYNGVFVGVMNHPTFFQKVGSWLFGVLDGLDDTHQGNVATHSGAVKYNMTSFSK